MLFATYRNIIQKVEDLQCEVISFLKKDQDILNPYVSVEQSKVLVEQDEGQKTEEKTQEKTEENNEKEDDQKKTDKRDQEEVEEQEDQPEEEQGGPYQALLLEFSLKKGSYATMLIREFLHQSSSFTIQDSINKLN